MGDKQHSVVFDNAKIKRYVPGFKATIPFWEGMRRSVAWTEANPEAKKQTDAGTNELVDRLIAAVERARP